MSKDKNPSIFSNGGYCGFSQHRGFSILPYANHIKGWQLAFKISTSFNSFREFTSLQLKEYALGKSISTKRLFNSLIDKIKLRIYSNFLSRTRSSLSEKRVNRRERNSDSDPFISCSTGAVLCTVENTLVKSTSRKRPLELTECSTWLTYDPLETCKEVESFVCI